MVLGSVAFDVRRFTQHERRLRKVMTEPQPTVDRLTQAFKDEGTLLVTAPTSPEEKERVIVGQGGKQAAGAAGEGRALSRACASSRRPTCSTSSSSTVTA